jgi:hypothetical protein
LSRQRRPLLVNLLLVLLVLLAVLALLALLLVLLALLALAVLMVLVLLLARGVQHLERAAAPQQLLWSEGRLPGTAAGWRTPGRCWRPWASFRPPLRCGSTPSCLLHRCCVTGLLASCF